MAFAVNGEHGDAAASSAADLGGYHVANGALIQGASPPQCYDSYGQAYVAAAAKVQ